MSWAERIVSTLASLIAVATFVASLYGVAVPTPTFSAPSTFALGVLIWIVLALGTAAAAAVWALWAARRNGGVWMTLVVFALAGGAWAVGYLSLTLVTGPIDTPLEEGSLEIPVLVVLIGLIFVTSFAAADGNSSWTGGFVWIGSALVIFFGVISFESAKFSNENINTEVVRTLAELPLAFWLAVAIYLAYSAMLIYMLDLFSARHRQQVLKEGFFRNYYVETLQLTPGLGTLKRMSVAIASALFVATYVPVQL